MNLAPRWRAAWSAFAATLCSFVLAQLALLLLDQPVVTVVILKTVWQLTPWHGFPSPLIDEHVLTVGWFSGVKAEFVGIALTFAFLAAEALFLSYAASFFATAGAYRWLCWPPYGREVPWRRLLSPAFRQAAWRSLWIFPALQVISALWHKLGWALVYAHYALIPGYAEVNGNAIPYDFMFLVLVFLGYAATVSRTLRRMVLTHLPPNERRCDRCSYPLRSLTEPRCPECGKPFDPDAAPGLRLGRPTALRNMLRACLLVGLPTVLFLAPLLGAVVVCVWPAPSGRIRSRLPASFEYSRSSIAEAANWFPGYEGKQWVVRGQDGVAIIRPTHAKPSGWRCETAWRSAVGAATTGPAESTDAFEVLRDPVVFTQFSVGPWSFGVKRGPGDSIWLRRPEPMVSLGIAPVRD